MIRLNATFLLMEIRSLDRSQTCSTGSSKISPADLLDRVKKWEIPGLLTSYLLELGRKSAISPSVWPTS